MLGAGLAVALRIVLTFFVAQMMNLPWLHLVGGVLILWIAVKVLIDSGHDEAGDVQQAKGLMSAMWIILVADITMSLDNVLAVAGASHGNLWLLIFGLGLSIPLVVGASGVLSKLMDKYPVIAFFGSAVLGRVGAEMILQEKAIEAAISLDKYEVWAVEIAAALAVVATAKVILNRRAASAQSSK